MEVASALSDVATLPTSRPCDQVRSYSDAALGWNVDEHKRSQWQPGWNALAGVGRPPPLLAEPAGPISRPSSFSRSAPPTPRPWTRTVDCGGRTEGKRMRSKDRTLASSLRVVLAALLLFSCGRSTPPVETPAETSDLTAREELQIANAHLVIIDRHRPREQRRYPDQKLRQAVDALVRIARAKPCAVLQTDSRTVREVIEDVAGDIPSASHRGRLDRVLGGLPQCRN